MNVRLTWCRARNLAVVGIFIATPVAAQPGPPAANTPSASTWTVSGGIESLWWRDIASTGPPVDASPVSWEGEGPVVYVSHDRGAPHRLHHFEGSYTWAGGFELQSPVRTTAAADNDGASRLSGRYEYRKYLFRDLWMTGFDIGIGVESRGEYLSFDRHFDPGISLQRSLTNLGAAGVVSARVRRWSRWSVTAAWGNGAAIGRSTQHYTSAATDATRKVWGGGWETTLDLRANVRVTPRASVHSAFLTGGEGRFATQDAFTYGRSRFTMGVTYGR